MEKGLIFNIQKFSIHDGPGLYKKERVITTPQRVSFKM